MYSKTQKQMRNKIKQNKTKANHKQRKVNEI